MPHQIQHRFRPGVGMIAVIALALASSSVALGADPSPSGMPMPSTAAAASPQASLPIAVGPNDPGFVAGTVAQPRTIAIAVNDLLLFAPNVIHVQQGETIAFAITNTGQAVHEFMVGPLAAAFADAEGTPEVADIAAGQTASLTYTFDGTGPYAFACHEPGHFENGMVGYVILSGPDVPTVGTTADPRLISVTMNDNLQFMPMDIPVTAGETVTFVLQNVGAAVHEFLVGPADLVAADTVDGVMVKEADEIEGGHVKTVTYTFDTTGPYAFACHEPGHYEAGMKGTITLNP